MKVFINSKEINIEKGSTLENVFSSLNVASEKGMAIALNDQVVPRSEWSSSVLKDGDSVLIIKAASGG